MKKLLSLIILLNVSYTLCASASQSAHIELTDTAKGNYPKPKCIKSLPYPCTGKGYIVEHFGEYEADYIQKTRKIRKGVVFNTEEGAMAQSVCDGIVTAVFVYAEKYSVIIRHGEYLSVYSGLENVSVKRNQRISESQEIGKIDNDRMLGFQWRKGIEALNPEDYFQYKQPQ